MKGINEISLTLLPNTTHSNRRYGRLSFPAVNIHLQNKIHQNWIYNDLLHKLQRDWLVGGHPLFVLSTACLFRVCPVSEHLTMCCVYLVETFDTIARFRFTGKTIPIRQSNWWNFTDHWEISILIRIIATKLRCGFYIVGDLHKNTCIRIFNRQNGLTQRANVDEIY
jgi:hypothetical protein